MEQDVAPDIPAGEKQAEKVIEIEILENQPIDLGKLHMIKSRFDQYRQHTV